MQRISTTTQRTSKILAVGRSLFKYHIKLFKGQTKPQIHIWSRLPFQCGSTCACTHLRTQYKMLKPSHEAAESKMSAIVRITFGALGLKCGINTTESNNVFNKMQQIFCQEPKFSVKTSRIKLKLSSVLQEQQQGAFLFPPLFFNPALEATGPKKQHEQHLCRLFNTATSPRLCMFLS